MTTTQLKITGAIPPKIPALSKLASLYLHDTGLSGTLPSEITLMIKLQELRVGNTNMHGTIPEELFRALPSMKFLDLSGCHFSGTVSTSVGLLSNLQLLFMSDNELSGTIPEELGSLSELTRIAINGNNFTNDAVPMAICSLRDPTKPWELVADCSPDETTGLPVMACPQSCCTSCCDQKTKICKEVL